MAHPLTLIPTLSPRLQERFAGPHTQFACNCFYALPADGSMVQAIVVVSCTQVFVCNSYSYVLRAAVLERLLAIYHREVSDGGGSGEENEESELLLVFDKEHDMLLRGKLTCDGHPPKPLLGTLERLYACHHPGLPLPVHRNTTHPLRDVAKLKVPPGYVAPLPSKEEDFENCPCWRAGDALDISEEEFDRRLRNMFVVYCPEKLPTVPQICRRYAKKKGGALQFLISKYGPEPSEEHAKAVRTTQLREERFQELLGVSTAPSEAEKGSPVKLETIMHAQSQKHTFSRNALTFPQLLLSQKPSGGYGSIQLRVTPIPVVPQREPYRVYRRGPATRTLAPGRNKGKEPAGGERLWYLCNESYVLSFDVSDPVLFDRFGYRCGDRVLSTWGATRGKWSTIIGVRDNSLWVHDDGDVGATMLAGMSTKEELEQSLGWMFSERIQVRPVEKMRFQCGDSSSETVWLNITPEAVFSQYGVYHGEKLRLQSHNRGAGALAPEPEEEFAVVAGVHPTTHILHVQYYTNDYRDASSTAGQDYSVARNAERVIGGGDPSSIYTQRKRYSRPVTALDRCRRGEELTSVYALLPSTGHNSCHIVVGLPSLSL